MTTLMRWDPFQEMNTMRNLMDRFFNDDRSLSRRFTEEMNNFSVPMDVMEDENSYIVKASIPGINPEDVEITVDNNMLTIRGALQEEEVGQKGQYHVRERRTGSFMRTLSLPSTINQEEIDANYENGVLMLQIPKPQESKPRRITVNTGRTISGQTSDSTRREQSNRASQNESPMQAQRTQEGSQGKADGAARASRTESSSRSTRERRGSSSSKNGETSGTK